MKNLILISMMLSATAQAASFKCVGKSFRNAAGLNEAKTSFTFHINVIDGVSTMTELKGHVLAPDDKAHFSIATPIKAKANYRPRKYLNSLKFENIDSTDGLYSLYGYLVIEKQTNLNGNVTAHYVFQADQNGGTIDLACSVNDF